VSIDVPKAHDLLRKFDFRSLFIDELGWDRYSRTIEADIENHVFSIKAFAEKRGVQIFECGPDKDGCIPGRSICRKIDKGIAKTAHERMVIFVDKNRENQFWLWVSKEPGKPTCFRGHDYNARQDNYLPLIQKLTKIAFTLNEEEALSIFGVTVRLRDAFDRERLTKRFYDYFKVEHKAFLELINGIPDSDLQRWYASVMISRIMFIYFIQENRFLDNDPRYLRKRLERSAANEPDRYYRDFLCPLFFEGFAKPEEDRLPEVRKLLGKIPYLNGGLFTKHQIEEQFDGIQISDAAFERIFTFFDGYRWHLDERPLADGREINPDVLGYIFEKYINQKQMGAYYTKEDITEYIGKNTIIPYLFDVAQKQCAIAFEGEHSVWRLLQADPDRYLHDAVKRGVIDGNGNIIPEDTLPNFVKAGMHEPKARMFDRRYNLEAAVILDSQDNNLALPAETWREYVDRRKRCLGLRQKLENGVIRSINDLITFNLNIRQFAQDVIETSEGPELLRAFWHAIVGRIPEKSGDIFKSGITILDPTCGSGAFLFAALIILEALYEACLDRMEAFVAEYDRSADKEHPSHQGKYSDFRRELARVAEHPNRRYFIMKSIIVNNLYGVDIMDEAVEICKLRLFLKLVAQVEKDDNKPNFGIEPLPDIDFNIRAGNTLVGFTTKAEVKEAVTHAEAGQMKLLMGDDDTLSRIEEKADMADRAFKRFRQQQTQYGATSQDLGSAKAELKERLRDLENELNRYLAKEYGVNLGPKGKLSAYEKWLKNYQPFHWFIEFFGIMKQGGFDVIIGNPPYVEYSKVKTTYSVLPLYKTLPCGNIYTMVLERCYELARLRGRVSLIVPLSLVCTNRTNEIRDIVRKFPSWISSYDMRPSSLFEGVAQRLSIIITQNLESDSGLYSGGYRRWSADERTNLINLTSYAELILHSNTGPFPKIALPVEHTILAKIDGPPLEKFINKTSQYILVHRIIRYFVKALNFVPLFQGPKGDKDKSDDYKEFRFDTEEQQQITAILNSTLFYWFWRSHCDGFHCGYADVYSMPYKNVTDPAYRQSLEVLVEKLIEQLQSTSAKRTIKTKAGQIIYQEFYPAQAKTILDEIDQVLSKHYDFTEEELDFIVNYDIKYRLGLGAGEEDEAE
jgi:hypothetical protein